MTTTEKLSIALTPELAARIRAAVESGDYASTSEVIRDALRDWLFKREVRARELERLGAPWDEGMASGSGRHQDIEAIIAEGRRRAGKSSNE